MEIDNITKRLYFNTDIINQTNESVLAKYETATGEQESNWEIQGRNKRDYHKRVCGN